jgi:GNAT superfamily N-acetyltransferase
MEIALKTEFTGADIDVVRAGLIRNNEQASGRKAGYFPFVFHLRDEKTREPVGGAVGHGSFDWTFVELLWLPAELRGQGHGTRLMQAIEQFTREHGLAGVWLDTFSFQARPFYEKLGYTVFGTLEDHPLGGARHFMFKRLT